MGANRKVLMACLFLFLLAFGVPEAGNLMSVQVKAGQLRSSPSFLGKVVAVLSYGDRVEVREQREVWMKVARPDAGPEGWMHGSALTTQKIVVKAGDKDVELAATSDELALAGKGFNAQVEREFRKNNPRLDFSTIDEMERTAVSREQMEQFLKDGELAAKGGAQ